MIQSLTIPNSFARTMVELYDEQGSRWIDSLPALLDEFAQRWSLVTIHDPFELSYNYVVPAVRADGSEVVVKAGVINPELISEMAALELYEGRGMVQLLEADPDRGIMLLERIRPGTTLLDLVDDEQATTIIAEVMSQLWRPVPEDHPFHTVEKWAKGMERLRREFDGGTGPFSKRLVEMAESLFADLIPMMGERVLLHGDLHHWNILAAERQPWLALDPKGLVGEAAYEVGALLRNPSPQPRHVQARRVDQLSEALGFDRQRILAWGVSQAVLSAWWSYEDHGHGWEPAMATAETLATLMS